MKSLACLLLTGCIAVPTTPPQMCHVDSDCDTGAGEVCQEGTCWGDPPAEMLAAVLVAPKDRTELATTELASFAVPGNGWFGARAYDPPVTISGQLSATCATGPCSATSLSGDVTVTRPSRIPGGPPFRAVATAKDGVFDLTLPATRDGDPPYVVTVRPDDRSDQAGATTPAPAELVPPAREVVSATGDLSLDVSLVASDQITGTLTDASGKPLTNYRVVALGRWDDGTAPAAVSTVDYSTDGTFAVTLASGVQLPVELVARSFDPDVLAPELHLTGVDPGAHALLQPHDLGSPRALTIAVCGTSGAGELGPVPGAQVTIGASLASSTQPPAPTSKSSAVFTATGSTGMDGHVVLDVLDGATLMSSYKISVVPPANSTLGASYAQTLAFDQGAACGTQADLSVHLASRLAISGMLVDAHGAPLSNVSVTARPSLGFTWSLAPADQPFLAQIPAATAVTSASGDFVVWVDPELAQTWGQYDLAFDPPDGALQPSFTQPAIDIPRVPNATTDAIGEVIAPEGAHLHGQLVDTAGAPVQTGELRLYTQAAVDPTICGLRGAPTDCAIPAQLVGRATSDDTGTVRITVAR